jgi:molecular chaperone GrpE
MTNSKFDDTREGAPPGEGAGNDAAEQPRVPVDAQAQAELEAAKAEAQEWRDRCLRKAAEFDNYRKRTDKERADTAMLAKSSVVLELLPALDDCERALESLSAQDVPEGTEQYRDGVELLYKQVRDILHRIGVTPIDAKGQKFDPHLHEAVMTEENSRYEENTVLRELRRGYLLKERLLRPAQVVVSTHPTTETPA